MQKRQHKVTPPALGVRISAGCHDPQAQGGGLVLKELIKLFLTCLQLVLISCCHPSFPGRGGGAVSDFGIDFSVKNNSRILNRLILLGHKYVTVLSYS